MRQMWLGREGSARARPGTRLLPGPCANLGAWGVPAARLQRQPLPSAGLPEPFQGWLSPAQPSAGVGTVAWVPAQGGGGRAWEVAACVKIFLPPLKATVGCWASCGGGGL